MSNLRLSIPQKRWRRAFFAIFSSRIFINLVKDALDKKDKLFSVSSRSPSYTILEIKSIDEVSSSCINIVDDKALIEIVKEKNPDRLRQYGGVEAVADALQTDVEDGICGDAEDFATRRFNFGSNTYPKQPLKGLFHFVLEAFKDTTILILLGCAIRSLVFGIRDNGWKDGWYEGGSIFVAVFTFIAVYAFSNYSKSRQFNMLSSISDNIQIGVMRSGRRSQISIFDIVVGDIVCLKIGDQIPADGLFLDGHSLQVDESSMTGDSENVQVDGTRNPFLISGAKVADGYGRMLVTSVGMNTSGGEMMSSISRDSNERTPLQERLDKLNLAIGKVGLVVAFLVLVVLLVRYFTGNTVDDYGNRDFNGSKTKIPKRLPLAVTFTLAYSIKRMMAGQTMIKKHMACETMGSVTTICTDKTGTLSMNQMKVTEFWLGLDAITDYASPTISSVILDLLHQGAGLNLTGAVYKPHSGVVLEFSGSPTEKAILSWAVLELDMDIETLNKACNVLQVEAFNSEKKRSGLSLKKNGEKMIHIHWKGAAEMILAMCSSYYDRNGSWKFMGENERKKWEGTIQSMAANSLRCIAFAHKEITEEELEYKEDGKIHKKLSEEGLTLLGLVGLKDPCRPGVRNVMESCKDAGVQIKMFTGDNIFTARAMAIECGILDPNHVSNNGEVVEGVELQNYTQEERMEKVDRIRVMARSSPFDKLQMIQCLKQKGHVVAVIGNGTNDVLALKVADIGLSMGNQGTEVAKESSDIVILDDNFASVATVLMWGRCVCNNIQKFIQFQLTVIVVALVINFVAAISAGKVPLTTVQLLWVNLIMDTLGALALSTEQPTEELMEKPLVGRIEPLITNVMWRNLMAQALYQVSIFLTLQFRGESLFSVDTKVNDTLIFNTVVLCQVFNVFNARNLEKKNVFKGIHKNKLFLGIVGITIILQVVMVEFLKRFAGTERLDWREWCLCIGLAAMSWPIGWLVKWIPVPEKPFLSFFKWEGLQK